METLPHPPERRFDPPPQVSAPWAPSTATGDLASRIRAGDARAEDEMVVRHGPQVAALLSRRTRDRAIAEDLYQETFCRALVKLRQGDLRHPGALGSFLRSLAHNLAVHHYRARLGAHREMGLPEEVAERPSGSGGALEEILRREDARRARRALLRLAIDRDRQVLTRFYLEQQDKEEICRDLGISAGHFKKVLFRARRRYLEILHEAETPASPASLIPAK
jgi:RNA polymerase sigma-70 factor (ECF subfamily)